MLFAKKFVSFYITSRDWDFMAPFFFVLNLVVQADTKAFRQDLMNIAQTTLSSKLLTNEKNHFGVSSFTCRLDGF